MLEPVHSFHFADLVETALLKICLVAHAELLQADGLAPRLEEPHTGVDDR